MRPPPRPTTASSHLLFHGHGGKSQPILCFFFFFFFCFPNVCFLRVFPLFPPPPPLCPLFPFSELSIVNSHSLHLSVSFWLFSLLFNLSFCNFLDRLHSSQDLPLLPDHTPYCLSLIQSLCLFSLHLHLTLLLSFISVAVFFALVTGGDYVGLSGFCPSRCLWPRSIMAFPFSAGSHWCAAAGREIEREENQAVGASKMIRFAAGAKVCAASESRSPFSLSMSPVFKQKNRFDVRIIQQTTPYTAANLLSMIVLINYPITNSAYWRPYIRIHRSDSVFVTFIWNIY